MGAALVVVGNPFGQDPAQVFLTQWDHEVQALTTYSAHQPFAVGIRLRCSRGRAQHAQPKCFELVVYLYRKDGVALANQKAVGMIPGDRFPELLQGPLGGRVACDIAVQDAPRPNLHHEEHKQDSKPSGNDNEEIAGHKWTEHDCGRTSSSVGRRFLAALAAPTQEASRSAPYAGKHRCRASAIARRPREPAPGRILQRNPDDELADVLSQSRPANPRFQLPEQLETSSMPADKSLRLDDHQRALPVEQLRPDHE